MNETLNRFSLLDRYFEKAEEDKQNFKSYKKKRNFTSKLYFCMKHFLNFQLNQNQNKEHKRR